MDEYLKMVEPYRQIAQQYYTLGCQHINALCKGYQDAHLLFGAVLFTLITVWIWQFLFRPDQSEYY